MSIPVYVCISISPSLSLSMNIYVYIYIHICIYIYIYIYIHRCIDTAIPISCCIAVLTCSEALDPQRAEAAAFDMLQQDLHDSIEGAAQDSSKGGAVETGCSDLYAATYYIII